MRDFHGGFAAKTALASNTDNGIIIDPTIVDVDALAASVAWLHGSPASCVTLTEPNPAMLETMTRLGLVADNTANEMTQTLHNSNLVAAVPDGYSIVEIHDDQPELLDLGVEALDWHDPDDRRRRVRVESAFGLGPGSALRRWLAMRHATAVGLATVFRFDYIVELQRCGIQPAHQRRGLASALTAVRLHAAVADGACVSVLSPSPDGYKLHRRLGFTLVRVKPNRWFHVATTP